MFDLFPFNNYFLDVDRGYSLAEQVDVAVALGCRHLYLSVRGVGTPSRALVAQVPGERCRAGVGVAAVFMIVDPRRVDPAQLEDVFDVLEPGEVLEFAFDVGWMTDLSNPCHDAAAVGFLRGVLDRVRGRGGRVSLYHHYGFWMERLEDCVRLLRLVDDPLLGVTFCGYHWYACGGRDVRGALALVAPWLRLVNVCGSRWVGEGGYAGVLPASIEPVGRGDFPLVDCVAALREVGYVGPVGFQGYKMGGDPEANLRESVQAFRAAEGLAALAARS